MKWEQVHTDDCSITRERAEVMDEIATTTVKLLAAQRAVKAHEDYLAVMYGAFREYDNGGDQEVENCTCHWYGGE